MVAAKATPIPGSTRKIPIDSADPRRERIQRAIFRQLDEVLDYWGGSLYVYQATIIGSAAASHRYDIEPGEGNEFQMLWGTLFNGDTTARSPSSLIYSDDTFSFVLTRFLNTSTIGAGSYRNFPADASYGSDAGQSAASRILMAGKMVLRVQLSSVAISQDSALAFACRLRGDPPTVTRSVTSGIDSGVVNVDELYV